MFSIVLLGSCNKDIEGCTDVNATNYNSDATIDDGSCLYPVTNIPDTAFEQALIDLGYDDIIDGGVLTSSIANVDSLNIAKYYPDSGNIIDLTGLEDFISLEYILFGRNKILYADFSNNTQLKYINGSQNLLDDINVSGLYSLNYLRLELNNSTIDLSDNSSLETLIISGGQLSELDISNNLSLKLLHIGGNPLNTLNLENHTNITDINMFYTNITTINLVNCLNLHTLYISNPLSDIDLSQNVLLQKLIFGQTNCTSLNLLNNSSLLNLSVSGNDNLSCINLKNGNNLSITDFSCAGNLSLNCIEVDDPAWSTSNWTAVDVGTTFSTNCNYPAGCF